MSQEVWALNGGETIANRTQSLIGDATEEIVVVIGADQLLTEGLLDALADASMDSNVVVGALSEATREKIQKAVPKARVYVSGLDWLHGDDSPYEVTVGRLLMVDREAILVSSLEPSSEQELAVFGTGFGNGLVVLARWIMATGLLTVDDPASNSNALGESSDLSVRPDSPRPRDSPARTLDVFTRRCARFDGLTRSLCVISVRG